MYIYIIYLDKCILFIWKVLDTFLGFFPFATVDRDRNCKIPKSAVRVVKRRDNFPR